MSGFTEEQKKWLQAPLSSSHVTERTEAGRSYSYMESWKVLDEANRIFGFDGWDKQIIEMTQVMGEQRVVGRQNRNGWAVGYVCKVRLTVRAGERVVSREGTGYGSGIHPDLGLAHEGAVKEAEADATKRAAISFGYQFGLALYDKQKTNVEDTDALPPPPRAHAIHTQPTNQVIGFNKPTLNQTARVPMPAIDFNPGTGEVEKPPFKAVQPGSLRYSDHPKAPQAREAARRIMKAVDLADKTSLIKSIVEINETDFDLIKTVSESGYDALRSLIRDKLDELGAEDPSAMTAMLFRDLPAETEVEI
jgi:hypothetical protein